MKIVCVELNTTSSKETMHHRIEIVFDKYLNVTKHFASSTLYFYTETLEDVLEKYNILKKLMHERKELEIIKRF